MSTFKIAFRNLFRSPKRTALALAAIAVAQTAVLLTDGFMNGFADSAIETMTGPMLGHVQIHAPRYQDERAMDLAIAGLTERLARVRGERGVRRAYARIHAPALIARETDGHAAMIFGVDVELESRAGGLLHGLEPSSLPKGHAALVGAGLARDRGLRVGDELAILGQGADGSIANDLVRVIGILATPVDAMQRSGVILALETAQEIFAMEDMAHEITVLGEGAPDDAPALAARLAETLPGLEVLPWRELAPELSAAIDVTRAYGLVVLLVVFVAAAAGITNTMLMAAFERRRELGMVLALGSSPGRMVRTLLTEALLLGLAGAALGTLLGGALVVLQGHTGIQFMSDDPNANTGYLGVSLASAIYPHLRLTDVLPGFFGVGVIAVVATSVPALHTARTEPVELLRS